MKKVPVMLLTVAIFLMLVTGCNKKSSTVGPSGPSNTGTPTGTATPASTSTATKTRTVIYTQTSTPASTGTFTATTTLTKTPINTPTKTPTDNFSPTITTTYTVTPTITPAPVCVFVMGNPNTGAYSGSNSYAKVYADHYTPSTTMTINTISVGVANATSFWAAIYTDNVNEPGTLIVSTGAQYAAGTGTYNAAIPQQTLTAGTQYWLVVSAQSANIAYDANASYNHVLMVYGYNTIISGTPPPNNSGSWTYESGQNRVSVSYCN